MENLFQLLKEFEVSEIPGDRLFYLKALKELLFIGQHLDKLAPGNEELQKNLAGLKERIENYSLYPKLKNHEPRTL